MNDANLPLSGIPNLLAGSGYSLQTTSLNPAHLSCSPSPVSSNSNTHNTKQFEQNPSNTNEILILLTSQQWIRPNLLACDEEMNTVHVSEPSHTMIINVESDEDNFSTALATLYSQSAKNKENQKNSMNIARNMNSSNEQPPIVKNKTSVPSSGSTIISQTQWS